MFWNKGLRQFSWDSQQGRDRATSGCNSFFLIGPILFLYYEKSMASSNLNSKLLRFHCAQCAHPNVGTGARKFLRKNNVSYGFIQCKWQLQWNSPRWNVLYFVDRTFVRILVGVFLTKNSISPDSIVDSIYLCNYRISFKLGIHPWEFVE